MQFYPSLNPPQTPEPVTLLCIPHYITASFCGLKVLHWIALDESVVAPVQQSTVGQIFRTWEPASGCRAGNPFTEQKYLTVMSLWDQIEALSCPRFIHREYNYILFSVKKTERRGGKNGPKSSVCENTHFHSTFQTASLNWLHYTDNLTFRVRQFNGWWIWHNWGVNSMNACKKIASGVETKQTHGDKLNCSAYNSVIHHYRRRPF